MEINFNPSKALREAGSHIFTIETVEAHGSMVRVVFVNDSLNIATGRLNMRTIHGRNELARICLAVGVEYLQVTDQLVGQQIVVELDMDGRILGYSEAPNAEDSKGE